MRKVRSVGWEVDFELVGLQQGKVLQVGGGVGSRGALRGARGGAARVHELENETIATGGGRVSSNRCRVSSNRCREAGGSN